VTNPTLDVIGNGPQRSDCHVPGAQGLSRQRVYVEPFCGSRVSAWGEVPLVYPRVSTVLPDVAGSRDEQAKAKLRRAEIYEVAVAFDPPT
jgi:hypothetical protein